MTWPREAAHQRRLPPTLPFGAPWPRISIVTPSFGHARFIEETILSVLNQGYPSVEHIIVDGGSTDGTGEVLARYADRLACVIVEPDRGQSHAINKGMARATGEILTWLNSDDRLAPGALAAVAMAFRDRDADMVAGICEVWRDDALVERHLTSCEEGRLPLDDLLDLDGCWDAGQFFYQPEVFFTTDVWQRAGARVDEDAFYSMDYELWLRFAEAGARLKVIGRPVAQFRLHAGQKTADPSKFKAELPVVRDRFLSTRGMAAAALPKRAAPERPARITFFNDLGFQYGAGIAHGRLAAAAAMNGHTVSAIAVRRIPGSEPPTPEQQQRLLDEVAAADPDLVIVGNLHGVHLPPSFLAALCARQNTAVVVHDLWIVTGRCAYTHGCERLIQGCDAACPTPAEYPPLEPALIAPAWRVKRETLSSPAAPLLLANSTWTRSEILRALGGAAATGRIDDITLGVGREFAPLDRAECRRLLGLPERAFLILLSATSVSDPRKGRAHLVDALARLNRTAVELVLVGDGADVSLAGFRVHRLGYETDARRLAQIYSAADLFVGPSLEEALGQVFMEAAACGVPSIAYAVGGVPEVLEDGVSGLLVKTVAPDALAGAIARVHDDEALRNALGIWARLEFENTRTLERSYHRLHVVLRRLLSDGERLLGRKIGLRCDDGTPSVRFVAASTDAERDRLTPTGRDGLGLSAVLRWFAALLRRGRP